MDRTEPMDAAGRRGRITAVVLLALLAAGVLWVGSRGEDDPRTAESEATARVGGETVSREALACDPLVAAHCLLPFPNDAFTVADPRTDTGRRVALSAASMPVNDDGVPVDPAEWNRNDGFSPGSPIVVHVPGLDAERSGLAPITDIGSSLQPSAPIVLLDAETGDRHPFWAELDVHTADPARRALIIRPARNLEPGHRYVVALRGLEDESGSALETPGAFRSLREGDEGTGGDVDERRAHFDDLFATLDSAGVDREDLYLAWDFTVASTRNLTERMLHIRDDAFAHLDGATAFSVTEVFEDADDLVGRRVEGTFEVPLYLDGDGGPGQPFTRGDDDLPTRNGTWTAPFRCNIPRAALGDEPVPARGVVYGHGLLGSHQEVGAENVRRMGAEHDMVFCATDWIGLSEDDVPAAIEIIGELSDFGAIPDRLQQGMLNTLFLGRLVRDAAGFASHAAFRADDGTPVLRTGEAYYDGNSQGGIMGAATTAVSTEWERAVLGVPGMNYSTLLRRSIDFEPFQALFDAIYTDPMDRALLFPLMQMLWDRGEANGYAQHLTTDPLPGTPEHRVLLHVAWNDHQVSHTTAEVMARTAGIPIRVPALAPGRAVAADPHWGIQRVTLPHAGSALVIWDSGTPQVPLANLAPLGPEYGADPHENPRHTAAARAQKSRFLASDGVVAEVCGPTPCEAPSR